MRAVSHILAILLLAVVALGAPVALFGNIPAITAWAQGQTDAISGATQIQAAPSGRFTICINKDMHPDAEVLGNWETFLSGADAPLITEDVTCVVFPDDAAGVELAENLQSRLAEHQMTVRTEEAVLALSKAEHGRFDILVMSDESASLYGASSLYDQAFVDVVHR